MEKTLNAQQQKIVGTKKFSKDAGYKIKKSVVHNEISEKGMMKAFPITVAITRIKCLGINLTKEVRNLYTENYTMLMKK